MKKYLYAGLLAACLTAPAVAVPLKLNAQSPEQPVQRRVIALCMFAFVGLRSYQARSKMPKRQLAAADRR